VIPSKFVAGVLEECGKKDIPSVVIITAGFREAGVEGLQREQELIEIAKKYNIRLIGPNCLGVIDTFTPLNASFAAGTPPKGPMAFMSQSGALGTAILDWARAGRLGLSKFVSLGNKADVSEIDLMRAWVDDPNSKVILMYSEGLPKGEEFIKIAREVTRMKPVVAIKSGVTQSGSRAVSSHTGSLAGSEQAYQAAFRQAGVLRANSMEEMFDLALALGYQPQIRGERIGIITNAGGPGILATDALERNGMTVASMTPKSIQELVDFLPGAASAVNPVDVLGDARADRYEFAIKKVANDPNVDGVLVILTPQAMTEVENTAEAICQVADQTDKPILSCFMGEATTKSGIEILTQNGVPNYSFPERAAHAFRAMADYRHIQTRPLSEFRNFDVDNDAVQVVLDKARSE
jgi:acetyltransferase